MPASKQSLKTLPLSERQNNFSKPFIPESLTPLFFTSLYGEVSKEVRLRYNQLHACYCNEQIMFFETRLAPAVLNAMHTSEISPVLKTKLERFLNEERLHTEMFRRLNAHLEPKLYSTNDFYFIDPPKPILFLFESAAAKVEWFPLWIWLMLLQEEKAIHFAQQILQEKKLLESCFVETHKAHLADEIDHVKWDEEMIEAAWTRRKPWIRKLNARLLELLLKEFFMSPKRSNLRVLECLIEEFPELERHRRRSANELKSLNKNPDWVQSLYSKNIAPRTFRLFNAWREFLPLAKILDPI